MKLSLQCALLLSVCAGATSANAQDKQAGNPPSKAPRPVTRLIWQDHSNNSVRWGDLLRDSKGMSIDPQVVSGFPKLDLTQQSFVQMEDSNGMVVVGIHDNDNGNFQSGWVAINSGVDEEEHGNHSHWHYIKPLPLPSLS